MNMILDKCLTDIASDFYCSVTVSQVSIITVLCNVDEK